MYDFGSKDRSQLSGVVSVASKSQGRLLPVDHRKYRGGLVSEHLKDYTFQPQVNDISRCLAANRKRDDYYSRPELFPDAAENLPESAEPFKNLALVQFS